MSFLLIRQAFSDEKDLEELLKIIAVVITTTAGFTIAGAAGFGGGVVAIPVLVWVFGVREAIPIFTISQMLSVATRVWLHRSGINWSVVRNFTVGGMPFCILGSLVFVSINTEVLVRILGGMMLLILVYTRLPIGRNFNMRLWGFVPVGSVTGFASGFMGFPGPFAVVFYLAYGLAASSFIGTLSLGMALIQLPKLFVFGTNGLLTPRVLLLGLGLGIIGIGTAYLGRIILWLVPEKVFPWVITAMLLISGVILLVRG